MLPRIFFQRSIGAPIATPLPVSAGRSQHDALRGILLMCAGVSMFPFMNAAVKLLGADYPVAQIVWARFTGHLLVMLLVFLPQYGRRLLATRRPAVQIGRSLLMLVSNMMFVVAITRVPLATASAIGFTSPLIVTALSVPILHESVGIRRWSAVIIGFAGALLVIRPGSGLHDLAVLLLLLSSGAYALYQIATRWVSFYDDGRDRHHLHRAARLLRYDGNAALCVRDAEKRARHSAVRQPRSPRRRRTLPRHPCLSVRTGGGHCAARLYRADRHDNPRLSGLWQFPRFVDLDRRRGHHRLGPLHRLPRAAAIRGPLISEPVMDFTIPDELLELKERTENFVRQEILARENDRRLGPHGPSDDFRRELVALARRAGLLSPHVGREWGGLGL